MQNDFNFDPPTPPQNAPPFSFLLKALSRAVSFVTTQPLLFVQRYGWHMVLLFVLIKFLIPTYVTGPLLRRHRDSTQRVEQERLSSQHASRLKEIRLAQQREAEQAASASAALQSEKKKRDAEAAVAAGYGGASSPSPPPPSTAYNPLQPGTSSRGGGRFVPQNPCRSRRG